jgi:hypothetical protein
MELSTTREATGYAAIRELPSILWNPKVRYRKRKSHPLFPILSQISPVHITQFYSSKIHIIIIIIRPPTSWSS